jgi:uncharacterized protein with von Willebrand factor type A (vWA) domain
VDTYRRYDGRQDPLGDDLDVGEVLERLGDDLLNGLGGRSALERLQREGIGGRRGLDELREQVRARQQRLRDGSDLGGPLAQVTEELEAVLDLERAELARRDDDTARWQELELDTLPPDAAGRLRALREHTFASDEAAARFAALQEQLTSDILDAHLRELTGALESVTAEDIAAVTRMLADLNALLEQRERGEEPDVEAFLAAHGHLFPEGPRTLDEILEILARRAAAMSQLLASMTPEQRAQLRDLADAVFDDLDLQFQLAQLSDHLRQAAPDLDWDRIRGDAEGGGEHGSLSGLVDRFEELTELDALAEALAGEYAGAALDDVDEDALRRHLGEDAVRDLTALRRIEAELERAGVLQRRDGELELTPRGARLLGERALTSLLDRVRRQPSVRAVGADPEPTGQTRPWQFGDREPIAVQRTVTNAVLRQAGTGEAPTGRVRLRPDDFEVVETEVRPRTATALLLDLSFSMPLQGHFVPAKRMALALHALIEGKHRQDSLHLIGFSDYARPMRPADLASAGFERVYGTNMQHAFLLARRTLVNDPRPVKQVVMVTDGEPTAHLDGAEAVFHWPPVAETLERTLREAMRLARSGISLNIFLLEDAPGLVAFAERLTQLTGGAVFQMRGDEVAEHVVGGYGRE